MLRASVTLSLISSMLGFEDSATRLLCALAIARHLSNRDRVHGVVERGAFVSRRKGRHQELCRPIES